MHPDERLEREQQERRERSTLNPTESQQEAAYEAMRAIGADLEHWGADASVVAPGYASALSEEALGEKWRRELEQATRLLLSAAHCRELLRELEQSADVRGPEGQA